MYCKNCGNEVKEENNFCTKCGMKIDKEEIIINAEKRETKKENVKLSRKEKILLVIVILFLIIFMIYLLIRQGVINIGRFYF